jgi:murein DD-endopeptidase MepM/ murein hydrolase activator NlpD
MKHPPNRRFQDLLLVFALLAPLFSSCNLPLNPAADQGPLAAGQEPQATPTQLGSPTPTTYPGRPHYAPGELVEYTAQTGDTLPSLAIRFNTSVEEIRAANPFIPDTATTMPPGMPMKIPTYYLPLWGSPYRIIPDSLFINGPAQVGFNTTEFIQQHPGWLKKYVDFVGGSNRGSGEIVDYVARNHSVSPRLLLALLEYQAGALTQPALPDEMKDFPLGNPDWAYKGTYMQMNWAANLLNNGYYEYRQAKLSSITYKDGRLERLDPGLNAATASLHNYFNLLYQPDRYEHAISPEGFARTYSELFGDPWQNEQSHIPGSLIQPELILPFQLGDIWALTGGPHSAWGTGEPFAAIDFAPPSKFAGCVPSGVWATAAAPGLVVRSETGQVMIDIDGDGDERTGWVLFYLHIATEGRIPLGTYVKRGDAIGHPSCEGGSATGTHIHFVRKYNGEWMPAQGVLAYNLEGWVAFNGSQAYLGTLRREAQVVTACTCSNAKSFIESHMR